MFKKRIVCYTTNIRMDDMSSTIRDIECVNDNIDNMDIEEVFKDLIRRKIESIKRIKRTSTSINLLFTKEQINGDNSVFIIGYSFDTLDDLNDSTIVIRKYKVEYSDFIEVKSTLSFNNGLCDEIAGRVLIKRSEHEDLDISACIHREKTSVINRTRINENVTVIEDTPNKVVMTYTRKVNGVFVTRTIEVIR